MTEGNPHYMVGGRYWMNENNELHREDGPAIHDNDDHREWFINGERHNENGPAVIYITGNKEWWINNEFIKLEYDGKIYMEDENPCDACIVGVVCMEECDLGKIFHSG